MIIIRLTLNHELFLPENLISAASYVRITSHTSLLRDIKVAAKNKKYKKPNHDRYVCVPSKLCGRSQLFCVLHRPQGFRVKLDLNSLF